MKLASFAVSLLLAAPLQASIALVVTPAEALADVGAEISVTGLAPGQIAVIDATSIDADGNTWRSWASFAADRAGHIQPSRQAPLHGTYQGIDGNGLLWSMQLAGRPAARFAMHLDAAEIEVHVREPAGVPAARIVRRFIAPHVERTVVSTDTVHGVLYRPARPTPGPAVAVIGGSEGGYGDEQAAALIASHGVAALAVAYFGLPSLPAALDEIPIETFTRAIDFLRQQAFVDPDRIGLVGTSKGAEAALITASVRPDVRRVVLYAPSDVAWSCICSSQEHSSWTIAGKPVSAVPFGNDPAYAPPAGFTVSPVHNYLYRRRNTETVVNASIAVDTVRARLLLIAGEEDELWPSSLMARRIAAQGERPGGRDDVLIIVKGAGHLIGKHRLAAGGTTVAGGRIETGGTRKGNADAFERTWPVVLRFLSGL